MTNKAAMQKLAEEPTRKAAVCDVLKTLNGENYSDAIEILELAKHFLSIGAMLDYELTRDIINQADIE